MPHRAARENDMPRATWRGFLRLSLVSCPVYLMPAAIGGENPRSEEHTSELQSHSDLVCRLLLEKKKKYTPSPGTQRPRLPSFALSCESRRSVWLRRCSHRIPTAAR